MESMSRSVLMSSFLILCAYPSPVWRSTVAAPWSSVRAVDFILHSFAEAARLPHPLLTSRPAVICKTARSIGFVAQW